jgi:DNA-directed RNA polymerase subunit RPC12/RpoP
LSAALSEPFEKLADWPLGRRNRALAELLSSSFGRDLQGWVACPQCGQKLEFQMDSGALLNQEETDPTIPIAVNGHLFRLPTTRDLARAVREPDPRLAAIRLLESCRLEADSPAEEDLVEVGERMALADPLSEIRLTFRCADCGHEWEETLDLGVFLWAKIEARAKRLLREVHALGSAYGWTEKEILSLSETRRSFYLEMVEA